MGIDAGSGAPPGDEWEAWDVGDPFEAANGVVYRALAFEPDAEELVRVGFRVTQRNCNFLGGCHGGMLASLLDIAMGRNVLATGVTGAPTISLTVDFVRGAGAGDWLESRARVVRRTRRVAFCEARLIGPAGVVARSSGVFSLPSSTGQISS